MKTTATIIALALGTIGFTQQAEIVNGFDGFEIWVNAEAGELPEYWDGFNKDVVFNGMTVGTVESVQKNATDPYEGLFSAQITSTPIMGGPSVPGILTIGDFEVDWVAQDGDVSGGEAYTQLPQELYGQFKYTPTGIDTGFVSVWFLENGVEVGRGRFEFTETTGGWTAFSVAIDYDQGAAPDSVNMMFSSSQSEAASIPAGSVLEIDAIGFGSYLNTSELFQNTFTTFPNPASSNVNVSLKDDVNGDVSIVALNGTLMKKQSFQGNTVQLNVSDLASGMYQVVIESDTNRMTQRLVID
jgi:hypothetical protein